MDARRDDDFGARNRFLTDALPPQARRGERTLGGLSLSLGAHLAALLMAGVIVSHTPSTSNDATPVVRAPLTYIPAGANNGAPRGGESSKTADRLVSPATTRRGDAAVRPQPIEVVPSIAVPEQQVNAGLRDEIGSVTTVGTPDFGTKGTGPGPGGDGGQGPGGRGGPGDGPGGTGHSPFPGNGVSWPRLIVELKPNYTAEAMRARIEGVVELEIIIRADGSVGNIRLTRSLDSRFGLDEEAIKAVRGWRFDPARHLGKPVQVRVPVEVSFRLR
jgi:periplasmic protein TonB